MILAIDDQGVLSAHASIDDAPKGATIFTSPSELAALGDESLLDRARAKLLGQQVAPASSATEAASKLWTAAEIVLLPRSPKKKGYVWPETKFSADVELVQLLHLPPYTGQTEAVYRKLPAQARMLMNFLIQDGRRVWNLHDATQAIFSRASEMPGTLDIREIWKYYRGKLFWLGMLKKVSCAEFIGDEEYRGLSLLPGERK